MDDSAIESDSEVGDVVSMVATPASSIPSSPVRPGTLSLILLIGLSISIEI